jgi:cell division protein FtsB
MEEFPSSSTRYDKLIHQIVQLNTDLQKTAALTQTLKSERDALRVTNEKLKDESRRLHDKCEKLQQIIVQETEEKVK